MKRTSSDTPNEETEYSRLLFNKSKKFVEKINTNAKDETIPTDLKPAWIDEDDANFQANIIPNVNSKALYTEKLKQKYETLMGTPTWAKLNKIFEKGDEQDEILRTVGHLHKKKTENLPKDFIEIKRLTQINESTKNEGSIINCVEFHPKISAALVAGSSGGVSLFSIGGDVNTKIHSFNLQNWKIWNAQFTPDGSEALIVSKNSHSFCAYNLVKAEPKLIQLPKVVKKPVIFQISPNGKYIATSDGYEEVFLICSASKELLASLKHNSNIVSVTFNNDCGQLYCCSSEGEIIVWDLLTYRALKKFYDEGCVTASCLTISPCGKLLATGSSEGIVNIYQTENLTNLRPVPYKVISNLTTRITGLRFNSTTEILAISSSYYPNAAKLVHIPSYHVFANFPSQSNNLHQISTISFSANSGYMALGNNKGCAYLYRLKFYKNY